MNFGKVGQTHQKIFIVGQAMLKIISNWQVKVIEIESSKILLTSLRIHNERSKNQYEKRMKSSRE